MLKPVFLPTVLATGIASLISLSAAEISGGGSKVEQLKPAPRSKEPVLAEAKGDAETWRSRIRVPAGFQSETWAAEPMLGNPVAFTFDDQGRCFTSETNRYRTSVLDIRHYMFMLEDDLASRSVEDRIAYTKRNFPDDWQQLERETEVVRLIEDLDGDGKADRSSVYADGFNTLLDGIASGVLARDGKLWFTNIPDLWLLEGIGPDGRAQKRTSLSHGWGVRYSYTGHDFHGLAIGPDGRLYFSVGDRGARIVDKKSGKVLIDLPDEGGVFRCELDGSNLELVMRGLRNPQELAFDDYGNLFTADNDSDQGDRERFVYVVQGADAGWRVGWQHHPIGNKHNPWLAEAMWEPRDEKKKQPASVLSPIMNIPDGPSGVAYYPGTGLPKEYEGHFFVCGFKGSTAKSNINTWTVKPHGAYFAVDKTPSEFLGATQATDVEFGPDSRMYFSDWGAEGWESHGRGRIYRVTHSAAYAAQKAQVEEVRRLLKEGFVQRPTSELAKLLGHADQRIRLRAQWALAEQGIASEAEEAAAMKAFASVAEKSNDLRARLHAIWGLGHLQRRVSQVRGGNQSLAMNIVGRFVGDRESEVRVQALKVLGECRAEIGASLALSALSDAESRVRAAALMTLAHCELPKALAPKAVAGVIKTVLAVNADRDEVLRHASVMALANCADDAALAALAKDESRSVRLGALLAYARLGRKEVAGFLADSDPAIVREAAYVINDQPITEATAELAARIATPPKTGDDLTMLRILNANFRLGTAEAAKALADFAASNVPDFLRLEALTHLRNWPKPPARDRIVGIYRPLPARDAAPAADALAAALPKLVTAKAPIAIAAAEAAAALGVKSAGKPLLALLQDTKADPKARLAAFRALATLNAPELDAAIAVAMTDSTPAMKIEVNTVLGRRDPAKAAQQLAAAFPSAALAEKQSILKSLGELKGDAADEVLVRLIALMKSGELPREVYVEVYEAAEKRSGDKVKQAIAAAAPAPGADFRELYAFALAGGDPAAGERIFKEHAVAQCLRCHKVKNTGGEAGPDLTGIARKRDRAYLLQATVDPNATIADGFQTVMVTLKDGNIHAGIIKAETADTLTLQMPVPDAPVSKVKKADIKSRENAPSGMPPGLGALLSRRELRDVVAYLETLK